MLKEEISLYKNEDDLWKVQGEIKNSGGNLALHLIGNLNHFIGSILGKTGYVRNRDVEFSLKNIPKEKLIEEINSMKELVINVLNKISDAELDQNFPQEFQGKTRLLSEVLLILITHLNYHLGQINYHRRMIIPKENRF